MRTEAYNTRAPSADCAPASALVQRLPRWGSPIAADRKTTSVNASTLKEQASTFSRLATSFSNQIEERKVSVVLSHGIGHSRFQERESENPHGSIRAARVHCFPDHEAKHIGHRASSSRRHEIGDMERLQVKQP